MGAPVATNRLLRVMTPDEAYRSDTSQAVSDRERRDRASGTPRWYFAVRKETPMRLFIAGATGVLGRAVVRLAVEQSHEVRGLARSSANEALLRRLGAKPVPGNLFDVRGLGDVMRGVDAVLHLATRIPDRLRPSLGDFAENNRIRTEGTIKLLEGARLGGARLYIQQSIAFIAARPEPRLLADDAP